MRNVKRTNTNTVWDRGKAYAYRKFGSEWKFVDGATGIPDIKADWSAAGDGYYYGYISGRRDARREDAPSRRYSALDAEWLCHRSGHSWRRVMRPNLTAIVYDKRGRILSVGKNSYVKTHPLQAKAAKAVGESSKIFLHTEVAALVKLKDWSNAYRIVVTRFDAFGRPVNARPCQICQAVIREAGIPVVEHT